VKPQTAATLALLRERGSYGCTPLDALATIGSFRLGARIWELKQAGYDIRSELVTMPSGKRVARYTLQEQLSLAL
jgi:hypothetical protein